MTIVLLSSGCRYRRRHERRVRARPPVPYRSSDETDRDGIGVYESARYVRELGGDVSIDSVPGAGTTVRVRLPLVGNAALPPASLREVA